MRTTVNLPDDVYRAAKSLADAEGTSLGEALAGLVRRGLRPSVAFAEGAAFPCFALPENAEPITLEQTLAAEDEL